jgi:hypothetical protein
MNRDKETGKEGNEWKAKTKGQVRESRRKQAESKKEVKIKGGRGKGMKTELIK